MIEALLGTVLTKLGGRFLAAVAEQRSMDNTDLSSVVTGLLEAVIAGNSKTAEEFRRLEQQLDDLKQRPYVAAMASGRRLLEDAAPAHRGAEDRRQMLGDARLRFADAIGYGQGPIQLSQAEVYYGLTWLAARSPQDALLAFGRAARLLEEECLVTFPQALANERGYVREQARPKGMLEQLRNDFLGPKGPTPLDLVGAGSVFDRHWIAARDHGQLQQFRQALQPGGPAAPVLWPPGNEWKRPGAAPAVIVTDGRAVELFGVEATLRRDAGVIHVAVANRRTDLVRLSVTTVPRSDDGTDGAWTTPLAQAAYADANNTFVVRPGDLRRLKATLSLGGAGHVAANLRVGLATPPALLRLKLPVGLGLRGLVG